jgi:hypothetical protein
VVKPPIFLLEGQDILAFRSTSQAEAFVEEVNGDEVVFDSEGTRLRFDAGEKQRGWPGYTVVIRESPEPRDPERLRRALTGGLVRTGAPVPVHEMHLHQLVAEATDRFDVDNADWLGSRVARHLTWLLVGVGIVLGVVGVGFLVVVLMALAGQR